MYLSASPGYTIPIIKNILQNLYTLQTLESEKKPAASEIATLRAGIPQACCATMTHARQKAERNRPGAQSCLHQLPHQVPVAVTASLMNGTLIQVCGNCGRYLCLPETPEQNLLPMWQLFLRNLSLAGSRAAVAGPISPSIQENNAG